MVRRAWLVIAAVALVVPVACGGKHEPTASSTSTTSVGHGTSTTAAGGKSGTTVLGGGATTTARTAVTQPASSAAALAALREFAAAVGGENFDRVAAVTTGVMAALTTVEDINLTTSRQHQAPSINVSSSSSGLAIASQTGDTAVGKGKVTRTVRIGDQQSTETFEAPIDLSRDGGVWRVSDATYDGASLVVREVRQNTTSAGVGVNLVSILDFGRSTAALITVRNVDGSRDVVNIDGGTITRDGVTNNEAGSRLAATTSDVEEGYAGFLRSNGAITRIVVKLDRAGQPVEATFTL